MRDAEYASVWNDFTLAFDFRPSTSPWDWPGFREPAPSVTYALSLQEDDALIDEFYDAMREHLLACARPDEEVYGLDWQHECQRYRPHAVFGDETAERAVHWTAYLMPDGDYAITLADDWRWGVLGHPWERSICVFGEGLVEAVRTRPPRVFDHVLRVDGRRAPS